MGRSHLDETPFSRLLEEFMIAVLRVGTAWVRGGYAMQRRSLLLFGALFPAALLVPRYMRGRTPKASIPTDYRELAQQLNVLAATIQTPADARRLVDFLAGIFSDVLPPVWTIGAFLDRIAQAEFAAVSDSQRLIPESRLAQAWNAYVGTIHVPDEANVTPAEVNNLRDGFLAVGRLDWDRGSRNIWSVPSIYATKPDGSLASGCRAVESIRILWDLANMPDNLKGARDRVTKGVLVSDQLREQQTRPMSSGAAHIEAHVFNNPVDVAARQYIMENGVAAYRKAVEEMLNRTLA
jgi:hypothetical protein